MAIENPNKYIQLFEEIENTSHRKVDGKALSCISRLVYDSGLKRKEIPLLKVKDVMDQEGNIVSGIRCSDGEIILLSEMLAQIQSYIKYLKDKSPDLITPESPLFPSYHNTKRVFRHWKNYFDLNFNRIRDAGVKHLYLKFREAEIGEQEAYKKTAEQFRLSKRHVRDIIKGTRQPAGQTVSGKAIERIIMISDEIDRINPSDPTTSEKVFLFKNELEELLSEKLTTHAKEQLEGFIDILTKKYLG